VSKLEKSIDVDVPVRTAYDQWTQFEEFPRFMEGVKEVRQLDDKRLHWRAEVAGRELEWDAEITQQVPDERIGWRSTSGTQNAGSVSFYPLGANQVRITLRLDVEPEGAVEKTADALGLLSRRIEGDLERFRKFVEERGRATGGWRGEIASGRVVRDDQGDSARPTA
jgi:uncharacterized membrane protein